MTAGVSRSINAACLHIADPRQWTDQNVAQWLAWTVNEFSLKSVDFDKFRMNGATLCGMGKERFLDLAPDFVGDILWEHLEMLQKGEALEPPPHAGRRRGSERDGHWRSDH